MLGRRASRPFPQAADLGAHRLTYDQVRYRRFMMYFILLSVVYAAAAILAWIKSDYGICLTFGLVSGVMCVLILTRYVFEGRDQAGTWT